MIFDATSGERLNPFMANKLMTAALRLEMPDLAVDIFEDSFGFCFDTDPAKGENLEKTNTKKKYAFCHLFFFSIDVYFFSFFSFLLHFFVSFSLLLSLPSSLFISTISSPSPISFSFLLFLSSIFRTIYLSFLSSSIHLQFHITILYCATLHYITLYNTVQIASCDRYNRIAQSNVRGPSGWGVYYTMAVISRS